MANSLSIFVKNISKGIHKIKCKYRYNDTKWEICGIAYEVCDCFLEYTNFKDNLLECKCLCCNKNYQKQVWWKVKRAIFNIYKFSNSDNNKFILLLWKDIYPYEYMDDWEKFIETSLPEREDFYIHLNMKDIIEAD